MTMQRLAQARAGIDLVPVPGLPAVTGHDAEPRDQAQRAGVKQNAHRSTLAWIMQTASGWSYAHAH